MARHRENLLIERVSLGDASAAAYESQVRRIRLQHRAPGPVWTLAKIVPWMLLYGDCPGCLVVAAVFDKLAGLIDESQCNVVFSRLEVR